MSKLVSVIGPAGTRSGYGSHTRDIIISLLDLGYNVKTLPVRWGNTPQNALNSEDERDKRIIETLVLDGKLDRQPDIHFHISIPVEFQQIGKLNVGVTAGVEWTVPNPEWLDAMNRMDLNIVPSEFVKHVLGQSSFDKNDNQGNKIGQIKCVKPIEVLFEGYDTNIYKKTDMFSKDLALELGNVKEDFAFLFTGHWLPGPFGHDRKDVASLIKCFIETFKDSKDSPALVLKTSQGTNSPIDKYNILNKIEEIKNSCSFKTAPSIYLLHGELTDEQMNELYNHPKIKSMISFTKGEGFGRPLLEFSTTGKPIITTAFSGHTDFLDKDLSIMLGGELHDVHNDSIPKEYRFQGAQWFRADYNQAKFAMEEVVKNYEKYATKSYAQKQVSSQFTLDNMTKKLGEILKPYEENITEHVGINLPKLKKVDNKVKLPKLKKVAK